jgi:hypothetical protein
MKIEDIIASKQPIKSIELEVTRELNKIRKYPFINFSLINTNRNQLNEDQKNHFNV